MRNFLFIMMILGLSSCTQTVKEKVKVSDLKDTTAVLLPDQKPKITDNREKIIAELNKFSDAIAKKDKATILSFFNFPLADTSVNFFEVDSLFDEKRKTNNGKITKEMFSGSFDRIYEMTDMLEFNNLFADMNLELLSSQNSIKKEKRPPNDGCYYIYIISIKDDLVYFQYGTNSSGEYRKTHPDEEEVCDEYAQMWTFKFDGDKLRFLTHRIAG